MQISIPIRSAEGSAEERLCARALAVDRVLICDEATSALDVTVQKQIMELLQKLGKKKPAVLLFICHDPLSLFQLFCTPGVIVIRPADMKDTGRRYLSIRRQEYTEQLIRSVAGV